MMAHENQKHKGSFESSSPAAEIGQQADNAVRKTAQGYLDRTPVGLDLKQLEKTIRKKPMAAAGIATAAGFVVGGGLATTVGVRLIALFAREAVRETARNFMSGLIRRRSA